MSKVNLLFIFLLLQFKSWSEDLSKEGWIDLFDGKTLNGWIAHKDVQVKDGAIQILTKKNLWLLHKDTFSNFELEVELKMPKDGYNSGVGFRCSKAKRGKPLGYQCEIENEKTGSIYAIGKGWVYPAKKDGWPDFYKAAGDSFKPGEWNTIKVKCISQHIQIWVNGKLVTDVNDNKFTKGVIALQHHGRGDTHYFRKVRIKKLP